MLQNVGIDTFIERVRKSERIVCFGAGKKLQQVEQLFVKADFMEKMDCVIDNDKNKQGTQIEIAGKSIDIISVDEFKRRNNKNKTLILITCVKYEDIVKQLDEEIELKNMEYYCLPKLLQLLLEEEVMKKEIPSNIRISEQPLIPKVIHYCWFGGNPIPDKYKIWMESWQRYCPDYQIIQWDETNYDVTKNKYMQQAYEKKKWGFVPDYARLDIIYQHGGIYLDTDVELIQEIDDLRYQKGFVGFERNEIVNCGSAFGGVKGLPILKELRDYYDNMRFVNRDGSLNLIPSPQFQTEVLKKKGLQLNGEYQVVDDLTVYPEKMFNGMNEKSRRTRLKSFTRAIHHYDASWKSEKESLR